ncbi:MAG: CapA family protein [Bacteroidales bacterium]|nr:CapA family protein [Bacteroidales bacterium]
MKKWILTGALMAALTWTAAAQRSMESFFPINLNLLSLQPDTVSIYIVGDIMTHQPVSESAKIHGYSTFFKHIADRIGSADLAVGNMEFPLAGKPHTGYPAFSGPDEYAQYLSDIGFDVFLTANNHILDKGPAGLRRTIDVLEEKELIYTGISLNPAVDTLLNPLIIQVKGIKIALVNFTYGTNAAPRTEWPKVHYMQKDDILPILRRAREADLMMVFPHWGIEYKLHHNHEQEEMARWLVENGADVIIGTHPHVIQDVQYIDGVPVIYSLGNALSNQMDLNTRLELAVTLRIVLERHNEPRLLEPTFEYLWCTKPGMVEDSFSTVPVSLPDSLWRQKSDYKDMISTYRLIHPYLGDR